MPVSKPATVFSWATSVDADIIEPTTALILAGYVGGDAGTKPTAENFNWWLNLLGQWIAYIDDQLPVIGFGGYGGNGSNGEFHPLTDITLTGSAYYWTSITVPLGVTVTIDPADPNDPSCWFSQGAVAINGTITGRGNGLAALTGMAADSAGTNGVRGTAASNGNGGGGGAGGSTAGSPGVTAASGTGGTGGTALPRWYSRLPGALPMNGSGGGTGSQPYPAIEPDLWLGTGSPGGVGLYIEASGAITRGVSSVVDLRGADGGAATGTPGGGGGGGGANYVTRSTTYTDGGTTLLTGGVGGSSGGGAGGDGGDGAEVHMLIN